MTDYVILENTHRMEMINGKKVLDDNKIEYETPFEKKIQGIQNGKKYSIYTQKKPKIHKPVTFRIQRRPTPYYPRENILNIKTSNKSRNTKKRKKHYVRQKK